MEIFSNALTWIILLPVIGAIAVYLTPVKAARWIALVTATLVLALTLYVAYLVATSPVGFGSLSQLPYSINIPWIQAKAGSIQLNINYFLGVDGLSLPMVILNALLSLLAIIGGWEKTRVKDYMALLLILEAGVMGVFLALDLLLFFLFWEVELAPMFLLIGVWGSDVIKHGMPGRIYSAWKFLLYTFFGSIFMLAGILLLYFKEGGQTASMQCLSATTITASMDCPFTAPHILAGS